MPDCPSRRIASNMAMGSWIGSRWTAGMLVLLLAATCVREAGAALTCDRDDREGSFMHFDGSVALEDSDSLPGVWAESVTVQLFVRLDDDFVFSDVDGAPRTLVGAGMGDGTQYGWRLGCLKSKCCFHAVAGSISALGEVCTKTLERHQWYQLTATYDPGEGRRAQGRARMYVDGKMVVETTLGSLGDTALQYPTGSRVISIGGVSSVMQFVTADFDEIRLWNISMSEDQVLDTAHEIGWRETCDSPVSRVASIGGEMIRALQLYLGADQLESVLPLGTELTSEAAVRGRMIVVGDAQGSGIVEAVDFNPADPNDGVHYIEREPTLELLGSSRGVLRRFETPLDGESVTVVVSQGETVVLDYVVRDPNYDDVIELMRRLQYNVSDDLLLRDCYPSYVMGHTLQCNMDDDAGWTAYAGVPGYQSHTERTTVVNEITLSPLGEGAPDAGALRTTGNSSCLTLSPKAGMGLPPFLPPYTATQSRFNYRLAWTHLPRYQWWLAGDHQQLKVLVRSTRRYGAVAETSELYTGYLMHVSPEFVNPGTYPLYPQGVDSEKTFGSNLPPALQLPAGTVMATDGMRLAVHVGESLSFKVRVRDRNNQDEATIHAREDPGLPPGKNRLTFLPSERTAFPRPSLAEQVGNILCEVDSTYPAHMAPPNFFDRNLVYTPQELDMGSIFRLCLYARGSSLPPYGVDKRSETSLQDLCLTIDVLKPTPVVDLAATVTTFVGCPTEVPILVSEVLEHYNMAAAPYTYQLVPVEAGSLVCDATERCEPIRGGVPLGAELQTLQQIPGETRALLKWTPERGQELESAYRICFEPQALGVDLKVAGRLPATCTELTVRKCQMCLAAGQSLASVAKSFHLDFLELYMANPFIARPDQVLFARPHPVCTGVR